MPEAGGTRLAVYPGLAELQSGSERARVAFGLLDAAGEGRRLWSVLPIRITLQSGDQALQLGLNGLDFLPASAPSGSCACAACRAGTC